MKFKDFYELIDYGEWIKLKDNENAIFDSFVNCEDYSEKIENIILPKYGEYEVKHFHTLPYECGKYRDGTPDYASQLFIILDFSSGYKYNAINENSFKHKGSLYRFYYLENKNRIVFFRDNGKDKVDTFINWFFVDSTEYEDIVTTCIKYILKEN